ncbi:DUF4470 domain-containing protein [Aspergillus neoniger CBS 115656]|uniref:DUF4470 domain-containing protein n=1 Tax=Aspergillus neoniger (strain CBS 115656) TaxID=1448310 RepID=A0A318YRT4_ASPNB|nr:hypothetical protein BO87DRAFT_406357 [Aspergillus neoniger CBS 115656]PYH34770.1 hypothetical protein BO87DRAFT_406357 [Aspergillus neoniger CBS 115656]
MEAPRFVCGNLEYDTSGCKREGRFACKGCRLVNVRSAMKMPKAYWPQLKLACMSPLGQGTWQPAWALESRLPSFVQGPLNQFIGPNKHLWGNTPAIDVLQLDSNEGRDYDHDLRLLFAGISGDLRNFIETIAQLPKSYDRSLDVVARNVIMLLLLLSMDEDDATIDCIIRFCCLGARVRPLIQGFCETIKDATRGSPHTQDVAFGKRSLKVTLSKQSWYRLLTYFHVPTKLTVEHARSIRTANTLAESRRDVRDNYMSCLPPSHRITSYKFRKIGVLLPFDFPRHEFRVPNPLSSVVFQTWILSLTLPQLDAMKLPNHFYDKSFDRIEVSNIADQEFLGIHMTLYAMAPLLRNTVENPHATLITLFLNAIQESLTHKEHSREMLKAHTNKYLSQYLFRKEKRIAVNDPRLIQLAMALPMVENHEHVFQRFLANHKLHDVPKLIGMAMKESHTIVEKWPFRLKLRPDQAGAQAEFDRCITRGVTWREFYLE